MMSPSIEGERKWSEADGDNGCREMKKEMEMVTGLRGEEEKLVMMMVELHSLLEQRQGNGFCAENEKEW